MTPLIVINCRLSYIGDTEEEQNDAAHGNKDDLLTRLETD
jgi:hypothetical protein